MLVFGGFNHKIDRLVLALQSINTDLFHFEWPSSLSRSINIVVLGCEKFHAAITVDSELLLLQI